MEKIALFGTSADPPTEGHQTILRWLSHQYDWVAVWASDNPFKAHQTSLDHRMAMLQLLIDEIQSPQHNIKVYRELSYRRSLESVEKAQEIWGKEKDYYLVIGSDLANQIHHWYRVEALLQKVHLLIIPRPGYPLKAEDLLSLEKLGGHYTIAQVDPPAVSSTAYRQHQDKTLLSPLVKEYINRQQLYA